MAKQIGKWRIQSELGQGGQGWVYLVKRADGTSQDLFALKRLKNKKRLERFADEIEAATRLVHPNIVKCVDYELEADTPYIVFEHYAGGALSDADLTHLTTLERLRLFRGVCRGVEYAHQKGVIHRDIKPENVFLGKDVQTPVVGDFGICFVTDRGERVTLTEEAVGSRLFMAPELEDGRADSIGARVDVYSLGKVLYWLFRGRVFAREGKHRDQDWNISEPFVDLLPFKASERAFINELIDQSVTEDPARRFSDGKQMRANVERTIWRLAGHAHVTDLSESLICSFCGLGEYKLVARSEQGTNSDVLANVAAFGGSTLVGSKWLILNCNHCGHLQHFRTDRLTSNPWRNLP